MAEYSSFVLKARGSLNNVMELIDVFQNNSERKFFSVSEIHYCTKTFECPEYTEIEISGDCKWSLKSNIVDTSEGFTDLKAESKLLNLDIEVYSEEPSSCAEHYRYAYGVPIIENCRDFLEADLNDYSSIEEAQKELGIRISEKEWNTAFFENDGFLKRGGFDDWVWYEDCAYKKFSKFYKSSC